MPRLRLSLFYGAFFLAWGAVLPYWPVWYAERGLSPETIGLAGGVGLCARMLISPLAAFWSDGLRRAKDPLIALCWLTLAFWIAHIPVREPWMLVTLAFLTGAALYPVIPLSDSLAVREARRGGFAFGPIRAIGSSAFIVANLACGALISVFGGEAMLAWMIGSTLLLAVMALLLPAGARAEAPEPAAARLRDLGRLASRPDFILALLASGLIAGSHAFYYGFSAIAWRDQGTPAIWVGVLWGVAVAGEIVFFAVSARLPGQLSPVLLMAAGAVAAIIRWLALAASPPLTVLLALQTLHGFSFGATFLGFVIYTERVAGEGRAASVFALNSAIAGGAFAAVLTVISGWLYASFGAWAFAAMAIPAALGGVCTLALGGLKQPAPQSQPHSAGDGIPIDAPL
jgi:PPP family 3-phenylpropionic acid transporter